MDINDIFKVALLATSSIVVVINCFLIIRSRCCDNSVCIKELKNVKNNNSSNIQQSNINNV